MIQVMLSIFILILAIPSGYLLAWLCKEELKNGRKWLKTIIIISLILSPLTYIYNKVIGLTLLFFGIITAISFWKSYDNKFLKSNQ